MVIYTMVKVSTAPWLGIFDGVVYSLKFLETNVTLQDGHIYRGESFG